MSKFSGLISYLFDIYKNRNKTPTLVIDSFFIENNFNIIVFYHTNRYNITNKLTIEEFYEVFYTILKRDQLKDCTKLKCLKSVYVLLPPTDQYMKNKISLLAKEVINKYE